MRLIALMSVAAATLVAACDFQPGDPVQHALRDAAAAHQAAALKTTEEEEAAAAKRAASASPAKSELEAVIAARTDALAKTRALAASTSDPALRAELERDIADQQTRLMALQAHTQP